MAEEITKVIENIDELFPEIVVNGESHVSERYVAPPQASTPASTPQTQEEESTQPQQTVQGEYVDKLNLNGVEHDLKDSPLSAKVRALQELLGTIQSRLNELSALIPNQASAQNQLADKNFVNSSIATNTANFLGTYTSLADIEAIQNPTNNDYAFLETADGAGNNVYDRYKYSAEDGEWLFEYELNNSSFTAEQWATINSGITQVSDTVQDGDTNPVSSDAVYEALQNMAVTPVNVVENGNMHSVTSNAVYASELAMRNGSRTVVRCSKIAGDYSQHWAKLFSFGIGRQFDSSVCFFEIFGHSVGYGSRVSGFIGGYSQVVSNPYIWNSAGTLNNKSLYYNKEVQPNGDVLINVYVPTYTESYMWWELNLSSSKDLIIYNSPDLITDVSGLIAFITS